MKSAQILDPRFRRLGGQRCARAALSFERAMRSARRMEVVGEEGIAIDDMVIYLKGELYEFCLPAAKRVR